jgi:autoinducer 2 (AI-2) kinase
MGRYLMALDAGIGGGRCVVFDTQGEFICSNYREWSYNRPEQIPGAVEFEAGQFWQMMCDVTRQTLAELPGSAAEITAISATCMREGFVLLDRAGQEIYAAPSFDERGRSYNATLGREMGEQIYQTTGHWPAALHAPGRIMCLQEREPERWERAESLLMIGDWLLYRLTGEKAGEPSNLCSTVLLDTHQRDWAEHILQRINLPRAMLPPIRNAGELLGQVSAKAAEETGLRAGTPVVIGGGDSQSGLIGTGATRPGRVTAVAGTTTPILLVIDRAAIDEQMRPWTRCHAVPEQWCLEANAGMTGIVYRWVRDALCELEKTTGEKVGLDPYVLMNERAARVPIGANGVVVLASSQMDATRIDRLFAPGGIMGLDPMQPARTRLDEIIRATMENICYAVRSNIELFEQVSGETVSELRLCGGQARSQFWVQMQADILRIPVLVSKNEEATALGAAVCAGVGARIFSDLDAGGEVVSGFTPVEPRPQKQAEYEPHYERWLRLFEMRSQLPDELTWSPV